MTPRLFIPFGLMFAATFLGNSGATSPSAPITLRVRCTGLAHERGTVRVALFCTPEGYPTKGERACRKQSVAPEKGFALAVFDSLSPGIYAVSVFHDENDNGKLDFRLVIPKEGTGASNDARGLAGPPKFKDAAFNLFSPDTTITVPVNY